MLKYPEGKHPEGAKWMQPLQPSRKLCIFLPLGKRVVPLKSNCFLGAENPQNTSNYKTWLLYPFLVLPCWLFCPCPQVVGSSMGLQAVLDSAAWL